MHACACMCKQPTLARTLTCSRPPHGRAHEETHRHSKPAAVVAVLRCEHLEDHKLCVLRPWGVEYGCSLCHKAQAAAAYTARVAGTAAHAKAEVCAHTHRQASASDENRRRGKNNFNNSASHRQASTTGGEERTTARQCCASRRRLVARALALRLSGLRCQNLSNRQTVADSRNRRTPPVALVSPRARGQQKVWSATKMTIVCGKSDIEGGKSAVGAGTRSCCAARRVPTRTCANLAVDYPVVESQFCFSAHPYCGARRKWDFGVRVRVRMCV